MSKTAKNAYSVRFDRVFAYIDEHLDEDLTLEGLSRIANFSKFHFHRQFSAYAGLGVFQYVQLMRLRRASLRLAENRGERILDIALEAGFESHEAFSRAFKRAFGQTPSAFRRKPEWDSWRACLAFSHITRSIVMDVRIVDFPQTRIAALEHLGPASRLPDSVQHFIDWRKATGLSPIENKRTFGIAYSNPDTTPPEEFRFDICGEVDAPVPENPQGVQNKCIPAGRCAVVRHFGTPDRIGETVYPLYRDWLPESGEELRDFPLFFQYLSIYPETPEDAWQTDVFLPLK